MLTHKLHHSLIALKNILWGPLSPHRYLPRNLLWLLSLKKIDSRTIPDVPEEIRLFMVVRNESLRLPSFFKHYSQLGVDRFFVIDNGSTDDTKAAALAQKNTHVLSINHSYAKSRAGYEWINILLNKYGKKHWCLVADADEFFIYPHFETQSLRTLTQYLDQHGHTALESLLLDMYADSPLCHADYDPHGNPFLTFPYFDPDSHCVSPMPLKQYANPFLYTGGMRHRVFGFKPYLNKIPLFKFDRGMSFFPGQHFVSGAQLSPIRGTVCHFKYSSDMIGRAKDEVLRSQHYNNAQHYKNYLSCFEQNPCLNLYYDGAKKFKNSGQLTTLKIMSAS